MFGGVVGPDVISALNVSQEPTSTYTLWLFSCPSTASQIHFALASRTRTSTTFRTDVDVGWLERGQPRLPCYNTSLDRGVVTPRPLRISSRFCRSEDASKSRGLGEERSFPRHPRGRVGNACGDDVGLYILISPVSSHGKQEVGYAEWSVELPA